MTAESLADVGRLLALAGLVIGAASYFLLVRRRRRDADTAAEREVEAIRRRARSRFRRLERRDDQ